jgi:tetratricopeptide (TPR) repeat protein
VTLPLSAAEKWWDFYKRGVTAIQSGNYQAGIDALQRALNETPNEAANVRPKNETFTYVPHYWIGVARFQMGDADGALREWRASEEQGVVQKTPYYSQLREWVGKAQAQKQRVSDTATADVKKEANAAVGRALSAQMDAVAAGADRSDAYRAAQRKLKDAMESAGAGDTPTLRRATETAQQARDLFTTAADEAKKAKASRSTAVARQTPPPQPQPQPQPATRVAESPVPAPQPKPVEASVIPVTAPAPAQKTAELSAPVAAAPASSAPPKGAELHDRLEAAYRAFAKGDLTSSEQMLSNIVSTTSSAEAYLLRGCVKYTRSVLARQADMRPAAADFRAALKANRALHLDRRAFSPKLIAFFEDVKRKS